MPGGKNECQLASPAFFFLLNLHKPLLLQLSTTCSPCLHPRLRDPIITEILGYNICGSNAALASGRQVQGTSHKELQAF